MECMTGSRDIRHWTSGQLERSEFKLKEIKNSAISLGCPVVLDTNSYTDDARAFQTGVPPGLVEYLWDRGKDLRRYIVGINVYENELLRRNEERGRTDEFAHEKLKDCVSSWHPPGEIVDDQGIVTALNYGNNNPRDSILIQKDLLKL